MEAVGAPQMRPSARWQLAARRAGTHSLIVWPPVALLWVIVVSLHTHALAFDFGHAYLPAARAVLEGRSPYPPATVAALAPRSAFVYPPLTAFLAAPFAVLSNGAAELVATALAVACVLAVPWLLGVRDWRCYAVLFLWVPTYSAIQTANVTLLLAVGLALIWRYRDRDVAAALVAGFLVALKLFFWPVLVWLVATRRFRAALLASVASAALVFLPWAAIGFTGLATYPHLVHVLTQVEQHDAYTVAALLGGSLPWVVGEVAGGVAGLAVLAGAVRIGRSREHTSFALTIGAILLLSPIVSMHYFLFLGVVLCLFRPRFGWPWVVPLLFWVGPQVTNGADWQTAAVLAVAAGTLALAVRGSSGHPVGG